MLADFTVIPWIHNKTGRQSYRPLNFNLCQFWDKTRSRKKPSKLLLSKKWKLAAVWHSFVWYKLLEFLENSKWLRKNVELSKNLTIVKGKNFLSWENFFVWAILELKKINRVYRGHKRPIPEKKPRNQNHAEIIKNSDWFRPQGDCSLYTLKILKVKVKWKTYFLLCSLYLNVLSLWRVKLFV